MSSAAIAQNVLTASHYYTLYVSFIFLFAGVFGHCANIFVFTRLKIFRSNPSAFYLIAESLVNLLQMLISFTSRIAVNGFANDLSLVSLFWCKFRLTFTQIITLTSLSIVCFASIDQFLSTSHRPYIRQLSTIKLAKTLLIIGVIVWSLHAIPFLVFFEIHPTSGCFIYKQDLLTYSTFVYYLIWTGSLPITVSASFSLLAYRNVRRIVQRHMPIRRRKLDRQLTAMILARVAFLVITSTPYVIQRIYTLSVTVSKSDLVYQASLQLSGAVTISFFYLNYAGSFYVFLLSSGRYRRQVRYVFVNKCWRVFCGNPNSLNQVAPVSQFETADGESHL